MSRVTQEAREELESESRPCGSRAVLLATPLQVPSSFPPPPPSPSPSPVAAPLPPSQEKIAHRAETGAEPFSIRAGPPRSCRHPGGREVTVRCSAAPRAGPSMATRTAPSKTKGTEAGAARIPPFEDKNVTAPGEVAAILIAPLSGHGGHDTWGLPHSCAHSQLAGLCTHDPAHLQPGAARRTRLGSWFSPPAPDAPVTWAGSTSGLVSICKMGVLASDPQPHSHCRGLDRANG